MTERRRVIWGGGFCHFRGKRYKYRTPVAEAEKSVGGSEATIRAEETRGRTQERTKETIRGIWPEGER